MRENQNRGYKKLTVWSDAIELYGLTCRAFRTFPFEMKRVASQQISAADSIHRNIAEGYCRRSIKEYRQFLNSALGSLGESVSGLHAYHDAGQIPGDIFEQLDALAYKLENGLLKLVESLEKKRDSNDWVDTLIVKECNAVYGSSKQEAPTIQKPKNPTIHFRSP